MESQPLSRDRKLSEYEKRSGNHSDKAGIPAVLVTAIPSLAESLGVNRIVEGGAEQPAEGVSVSLV